MCYILYTEETIYSNNTHIYTGFEIGFINQSAHFKLTNKPQTPKCL